MRFFVKRYENNETFAIETSDDGRVIRKKLKGKRRVGERISAYIDVIFDEDVAGVDRLLEAMSLLKTEIEKRKEAFKAKAEKKNIHRKSAS